MLTYNYICDIRTELRMNGGIFEYVVLGYTILASSVLTTYMHFRIFWSDH